MSVHRDDDEATTTPEGGRGDAAIGPIDHTEAMDAVERSSGPRAVERPMSRRRALTVLGALPLAMTMASPQQQGQAPRQPHATPNQPAGNAERPPASAPKRRFFTAREMRLVSVLSDDVIPRDARSGSATDAGVPAFIDFHMSVPETSEETRVAMRGGLRWLDRESRARHGKGYAAASVAQRHAILDDIAFPAKVKPEFRHGAAFFTRFRDMVGAGFFSSRMGWKDVEYIGNVFNPDWKGCPQPALDKLGVTPALMETRVKPEYS